MPPATFACIGGRHLGQFFQELEAGPPARQGDRSRSVHCQALLPQSATAAAMVPTGRRPSYRHPPPTRGSTLCLLPGPPFSYQPKRGEDLVNFAADCNGRSFTFSDALLVAAANDQARALQDTDRTLTTYETPLEAR